MSIISLVKSLYDRASRLEAEAQALRADAGRLQTMFLGDSPEPQVAPPPQEEGAEEDEEGPVHGTEAAQAAPTAPTKMPSRDELRAKAAEFGVDVDDILPLKLRPTLQQKREALERIHKAKRASQS